MVSLRGSDQRTYTTAALRIRSAPAPDGATRLEGIAVPYGVRTNTGFYAEEIVKGAFDKSIAEAGGKLPLLLWHDNEALPVGVSESWTSEDDGLHGVWRMDSTERAAEAARSAAEGMMVGLSIGFVPIRTEWDIVADDEWDPNDLERMDTAVRIEGRLVETSLTPTAAFAGAQVTLVRSSKIPDEVLAHRRRATRSGELASWREWLDGANLSLT
jgi:HK97 family phage prohead protease